MKTIKTVAIPTPATRTIVESITCDLCGDTTTSEWRKNSFDAVDTTIHMREGTQYPECGSFKDTEIDICPKCFKEKLIPWVESHGGEPTVVESDY
jgi:RNA polymerase subunit RPABC4/transcription elongation factor Spt4